jgi:hypothetical protein
MNNHPAKRFICALFTQREQSRAKGRSAANPRTVSPPRSLSNALEATDCAGYNDVKENGKCRF